MSVFAELDPLFLISIVLEMESFDLFVSFYDIVPFVGVIANNIGPGIIIRCLHLGCSPESWLSSNPPNPYPEGILGFVHRGVTDELSDKQTESKDAGTRSCISRKGRTNRRACCRHLLLSRAH